MKKTKIFFIALIAVMFTSCSSKTYFQVYKTAASEKLVAKENQLVYEDDNCKVVYNLWSNGGNIGFQFFNKTDKNIYLNLEESFFVLNGVSYNYYKNRYYTKSSSSGLTTTVGAGLIGQNYSDFTQGNSILTTNTLGAMSAAAYSVAYTEEKQVCIPPKTSKLISEYAINTSLFRDCELFKYPNAKQIKAKVFSKEQSPLVFSNRIAYAVGQTDNLIKLENEFYVTEISNYPEKEVLEYRFDEFCGQKSLTKKAYFLNAAADKFYIKYYKGQNAWIH